MKHVHNFILWLSLIETQLRQSLVILPLCIIQIPYVCPEPLLHTTTEIKCLSFATV